MAERVLNHGWLKAYRDEWLFYMSRPDPRCDSSESCRPSPPANQYIRFDCRSISNNEFHFPNWLGPGGLCDLPPPYGDFFKENCCRSCHRSYTLVGQDWRSFIRNKYVPDKAYLTHEGGTPIMHPDMPDVAKPAVSSAFRKRMEVCDPIGTAMVASMLGERTGTAEVDFSMQMQALDAQGWEEMLRKVADWNADNGRNWFNKSFWGNGSDPLDVNFDGAAGVAGARLKWLGEECSDLKNTADECFKFYTYIMPLPVDSAVGTGLIKMLDLADRMYEEFITLLSLFIMASLRVQAAVTAMAALFPLMFAMLPGLQKGALKVQTVGGATLAAQMSRERRVVRDVVPGTFVQRELSLEAFCWGVRAFTGLGRQIFLAARTGRTEELHVNTLRTQVHTLRNSLPPPSTPSIPSIPTISTCPISKTPQVGTFLPQNPLSGYVLFIAPLMQLPMFGAPLAVIIQLANSWLIALAIIFLLFVMMIPAVSIMKGIGPQTSIETQQEFYMVWLPFGLPRMKPVCRR